MFGKTLKLWYVQQQILNKKLNDNIEYAKRLKENNISIDVIIKLTGLSKEEIKEL